MTADFRSAPARRLAVLLAERGWGYRDLAARVGVSSGTVSRWLNSGQAPRAKTLARWAAAFNLPDGDRWWRGRAA
jgi:transcriptional regulator with XRE-family HTH domain